MTLFDELNTFEEELNNFDDEPNLAKKGEMLNACSLHLSQIEEIL